MMLFKIVPVVCLLVLPASAYELREVCISEVDAWGMPKLAERKSGRIIPGNSLKELYKLYNAPDFHSQKEDILNSNDSEGIIVLCALWAYVVPGGERSSWRNEIVENVFGIKLGNVKSGGELINTKVFSANSALDSRLCLFLELLLANKIGVTPPPIGGNTDILGLEAKRGHALRFHAIAKVSGDADLIKSSETVLSGLSGLYTMEALSEGNKSPSHASLISAALFAEFGSAFEPFSKEYFGEISEQLVKDNPGIRLVSALLKKEACEQEYEAEIIRLAEELFPPAYPFMEALARKKGRYEDAGYFRYLANRYPWNSTEFIELCSVKGIMEQVLIPRSERFF